MILIKEKVFIRDGTNFKKSNLKNFKLSSPFKNRIN